MKPVKFTMVTIMVLCFAISNACSQSTKSGNTAPIVFEGTTPCDDASKRILKISSGVTCGMMKWRLTLDRDAQTSGPTSFDLVCVYGKPKQRTRGLEDDYKTIQLKGKWAIRKGTNKNPEATVYTLNTENPATALSFIQLSPNILHWLDEDNNLMVGSAAWSYTLNRIDPIKFDKDEFRNSTSAMTMADDLETIKTFEGRMPCNTQLLSINNISEQGCYIVKCQLILHTDPKTHAPANFKLHTIYVGKGDTKYANTGKWSVVRSNNGKAVQYQLRLDGHAHDPITLLKGDDNILFLLDKNGNPLSGDEYSSYTLNKAKQ